MDETRLFGGGVGVPRNHRLVPLFNCFGGMSGPVFLHPLQNCVVFLQPVNNLFKCVAVEFEKREQVFIEPNGFIVVTVKQSFAVQPGLIDQTRQMHVTAQLLVRTARMQSLHGDRSYVAGRGRGAASGKWDSRIFVPAGSCSSNNSSCVMLNCAMTSCPAHIPPSSTVMAFAVTSPCGEPIFRSVA